MLKKVIVFIVLFAFCNGFSQEKDTIKSLNPDKKEHLKKMIPKGFKPVNDFENLFNETEIAKLQELLINFKKETDIEISIFTLNSEFTTKENFEKFTLGLANFAYLKSEGNTRRMIISISKEFRRIRIQNSDELIKLISDEETKSKVDTFFIPSFKEEKYFEGTFFGVKSLIDLLNSKI